VIKWAIVDAISSRKQVRILSILGTVCVGADVICLQECAAAFDVKLKEEFGSEYYVAVPEDMDWNRNQNSMALIRKESFPDGVRIIRPSEEFNGCQKMMEKGDLLMLSAVHKGGTPFLIASFHSDSNGLATTPVTSAVTSVLRKQPNDCKLVFGMDANVYLKKDKDTQDVDGFLTHCKSLGLKSCWPSTVEMKDCCTTCSARTFLQPQLNKAVRAADKVKVNPKDHILVQDGAFNVLSWFKDNTGERRFIEGECLPSLRFPSDHGIVGAIFEPVEAQQGTMPVF